MKQDILSLSLEELEDYFAQKSLPSYRAKQVFSWLHQKKVENIDQMTSISAQLRAELNEDFYINYIKIAKKLVSADDNTVKYIYSLQDGSFIETVHMQYHYGNSVCISTQVGCKMGCKFCASTKAGFERNLTPSEMLLQIYRIEKESVQPISNLVLMGIGEPLENFQNVMRFFELLSSPLGRNFSLRRITLSTCGVVPAIYELMEKNLPITLSISLHAPNDTLRRAIMPIAHRYKIDELFKACDDYANRTHRRISYEYALIKGVNDSEANAKELADRLSGKLCHVNLIPINEIPETDYKPSGRKAIEAFRNTLEKRGISVTVRRKLGKDINAACGQLRKNLMERGE